MTIPFRLSMLSLEEGCGRKLAVQRPAVDQLSRSFLETRGGNGEAEAIQFDDRTRVIVSTDFTAPIIDDPRDFGQIAAANALSKIYARGADPVVAFALLGLPLDKLPAEVIKGILAGGAAICAEAGISMIADEVADLQAPIFGLTTIGRRARAPVHPKPTVRAGDILILTKAIGVGIYAAAFRQDALPRSAYDEMITSAKLLNRIGTSLADNDGVHAVVDVAGHGLLGHGLQMAQNSGLSLNLRYHRIPLLNHAADLVKKGFFSGISGRNWDSYGKDVFLPIDLPAQDVNLLTDPQTSGGLLISCSQDRAASIRDTIVASGYRSAEIIGSVSVGAPTVRVF